MIADKIQKYVARLIKHVGNNKTYANDSFVRYIICWSLSSVNSDRRCQTILVSFNQKIPLRQEITLLWQLMSLMYPVKSYCQNLLFLTQLLSTGDSSLSLFDLDVFSLSHCNFTIYKKHDYIFIVFLRFCFFIFSSFFCLFVCCFFAGFTLYSTVIPCCDTVLLSPVVSWWLRVSINKLKKSDSIKLDDKVDFRKLFFYQFDLLSTNICNVFFEKLGPALL